MVYKSNLFQMEQSRSNYTQDYIRFAFEENQDRYKKVEQSVCDG